MTYFTHVNRGTIDANRKHKRAEAPFTVRKGKYGRPFYGTEVELPPGSKLIYSAGDPILPCGARAVIVSETRPKVLR